ncbi:L-seryl-tRNA(Sec) selenium transferase [Candidatus Solincola tengchongensis]|uniref:L-seryl-tRNA(Sec) selenium transferase n=1 Tax=Candidatus Solincola tengchongensis TaxID=2900693 RepID=UPI002580EF50|nr:L-seryl-tRNA(Sec) selenium transferase [Candidatus Solincola tengchongensis]
MAGNEEVKKDYLRRLSSVNDLIQAFYRSRMAGNRTIPRELITEASRAVLEGVREAILAARDEMSLQNISTDTEELVSMVEKEVEERMRPSFRRVINATGVVVHTNLGRSILPAAAIEALRTAAAHYSNLEFRLEDGTRGSRQVHLRRILCELTGAESALVVNNNAAAVLLALTAHARDREVIVSRGQLIEIGGSFRLPEVMAQSGARLVEVGTTNKTYLEDYRKAITSETAVIMRAHPSNYRILGFTAEVDLAELASLAHEYGLILLDDLGSGVYVDLSRFGLSPEPTITDSLRAGADLVCFSGDKLLGGPQAGIILGREELVDAMAKHPLARALRADKLTVAALEATLRLYLDPERALAEIPTLAMITADPESLRERAERLAGKLSSACPDLRVEVVEDVSRAGGGSLPLEDLPTWVVAVESSRLKVNRLEERLRRHDPPVIGRIKEERFLLDVRTLRDEELSLVVEAFRSSAGHEEG